MLNGQRGRDASEIAHERQAISVYPAWMRLVFPDPRRLFQQLIAQNELTTGLDIGCGTSSLLAAVRSSRFRTVGIDVFEPSIELARQHNVHDEYILADFLDHRFAGCYDVVCLSHVIEHFDRDTGHQVLRKVEDLGLRLIYVETPNGFLEQPVMSGNRWQRHLSGWFPNDFRSRGYSVFGIGSKRLRGVAGEPRFIGKLGVRVIENALKWYRYRRPEKSFAIAAIRYLNEHGNLTRL